MILDGLPGGKSLTKPINQSDSLVLSSENAVTMCMDTGDSGRRLKPTGLTSPLKSEQRGLVLMHRMIPDDNEPNRIHLFGGFRPHHIRCSLLFWDQLVAPTNKFFGFSNNADEQFLVDAGILQSPEFDDISEAAEGDFLYAHDAVFRALNERDPGRWSLSNETDVGLILSQITEEGRGLLVEIHRAIAVPDKDVSLEDLLNFREKRHPELQSLRHHLEKTYDEIRTSGDKDLSKIRALEGLQRAVADELKVMRESKIKSVLSSIKAQISLTDIGSAIAATGTGLSCGLPIIQALALGAPLVTAKIGLGLKESVNRKTPFSYAKKYHQDLRWV